MTQQEILNLLSKVSPEHMKEMLFHLAKDPLPYRKLNYTLPGHDKCTLYEADDYIAGKLESWGYTVEREGVQVQAYRRDETKPIMHQYSAPMPEDPVYTAYNLYAKKTGTVKPDEIIVVISHKDSQSWIDSPGANDNAIGTVGNIELARVLADVETQRSIWFIGCNEEHTPWTSETAAKNARERGDNIIVVFNSDGLGVKSEADRLARHMTSVVAYNGTESEWMADLMGRLNEELGLGMEHKKVLREYPNDDDGSFVKQGYKSAVIIIGSFPYEDPNYHQPEDIPELTDIENAALQTKLLLATILHVDANGAG